MPLQASDRLIVALDYPGAEGAVECVRQLADQKAGFKVGLELFVSEGPAVIEKLNQAGASRIFLDLKFHDIPNTMACAVRSAVRSGIWMVNVHATAGKAALQAAAEAAEGEASRLGLTKPVLIAVTVLTSISAEMLRDEQNVALDVEQQVVHLAQVAKTAGIDGVVAPAPDAGRIKDACGGEFVIVSPGIRPAGSDVADQQRIDSPASAVKGGSDYLVVGRPITASPDPAAACQAIISEISAAC